MGHDNANTMKLRLGKLNMRATYVSYFRLCNTVCCLEKVRMLPLIPLRSSPLEMRRSGKWSRARSTRTRTLPAEREAISTLAVLPWHVNKMSSETFVSHRQWLWIQEALKDQGDEQGKEGWMGRQTNGPREEAWSDSNRIMPKRHPKTNSF